MSENGNEEAIASYEKDLARYLQERIKPGLNRGAIPLLARSIAKDIAHREHPGGESEDAEREEEDGGEGEDAPDFEADMHELQADLGDDWILRFSVHGDDAWLTAEKDDGSECVEAATASELLDEVERLNEDGSGD